MNLQDVIQSVEGHQFAAEVNLASGSDGFYRALRHHDLFRELADHMKEPAVPEMILRRLLELSRRPIQLQYENPFDAAMTTYLTALEAERPTLAGVAAEAVSRAPNCWWAMEASARLLARVTSAKLCLPLNVASLGKMEQLLASHAVGIGASGAMKPPVEPPLPRNHQRGFDAGLTLGAMISHPVGSPSPFASLAARPRQGLNRCRRSKRAKEAA